MYTSFHVNNFRGFADLQLNDLGRINLIAGKNNVGKTSVLLAVWFLSGYHEAVLNEILFSLKSQNLVDSPYQFDILFHNYKTNVPILIEGILGEVVQCSIKFLPQGILDDFQKVEIWFIGRTKYTASVDKEKLSKPESVISIPTTFLKAHQLVSFKEDRYRFNQLMIHKQTDMLVEALRVIEPRLKKIELLDNGFYVDLENVRKLLPLSTMGEGINRVASIILAMSQVQNGVLLIDEIENGLHYSVQEKVWQAIGEAARQFNVQIFATTHSLEMIRAAHDAFKDSQDANEFRYFRLDRLDNGEIEVVKYNQEVLESAVEMDFEVR